jgi:phosphohistidine swiveling domain-containing protein
VTRLCEQARAHVHGRHGLDMEIVVDPRDTPWLVQVRPLTAPLHPGWDAFSRAIAAQREDPEVSLRGLLTLDGEHNPAPLSPAHAWLMDWLRTKRPKAGDPVVLAGWLYVRTLPRALGAQSDVGNEVDVGATLARLHDEHLPRMKQALDRLRAELGHASLRDLEAGLDRALALFLEMIDCYLGELVPARRAHAGARHADPEAPLTLRDRSAFLDVLPAAWDVASPALADLIPDATETGTPAPTELPDDPRAAATLLSEWDDHLFALGLAPLRTVYLRAAELLALDRRHVFMLDPDDLRELSRGRPLDELRPVMRSRDREARSQARMRPPMRLWDGRPVPAAAGSWLRGVPIGDGFSGNAAPRRDLEDLLARPPAGGDVVCLPALTAQSAVALDRLGVRAICTEYGGALSHGALMARELGLSALLGCRGCTTLADGTPVHVDTRTGRLVPRAR